MNNKKKIIALIVVLATLVQVLAGGMVFAYNSVVSEKVEENNVQFKDISGHWAENSINYLANKGLVKGYIADDGYVIKPQEFITRAEFLTVLINSRPDIEFTNENVKSFIDVKEGEWYKEIVDKASSIGILSGYPDGSFKPNNPITRAEITALIMKFNNWSEKDIDYESKLFSDVKEGEWHFIPIMVCRSKKIVNGYPDGTFAPQRFALRGEAFALLANYVKNYLHSASAELDDMAPIVENKDITIYNQSSTSVTLNWYKAFDDKTAKENLRYAVYLSRKDNISNIEGVLTNGTLIGEYEKDIESKEIKGLASGTTYYFNVVVKDDSDNKTAYNPIKVFFRESSSNIQTGADDSKVIITSPQMGSSRYYTYESHVDISGVFTNKEIDKISYSVFYEGKEDKDSSYPAITKGSYDKNTNTTNWSIKDFPAKYLCVTVEIYITDKSGKRHMGWIDIVQEGDDDNDGLSNYLEKLLGTDPNNPDTDGDGLTDWDEIYIYETDPLKYDTDGDEISDGDEVLYVYIRDMDSEGRVYFIKKLRSELEPDIASALRVVYKDDNYVPADLDLTNEDHRDYYRWYYEYIPRNYVILDPLNHDTDEDGLPDGFELYSSMTSPSAYDTYNDDMSDADRDPDEDGLTNIQEYINGTDPLNRDTDGDSISDGDEIEIGTNPLLRDSDNDGTDDLEEIMRGTDPNDPDNGGIIMVE